MIKIFYSVLPNTVATSYMWWLNPWNVASATEEMNCYSHSILITSDLNLNRHVWLVAIKVDSREVDFFFSNLPMRKQRHRVAGYAICPRSESFSVAKSWFKPRQSDSGARTFNSNISMRHPEQLSQNTEYYLKVLFKWLGEIFRFFP